MDNGDTPYLFPGGARRQQAFGDLRYMVFAVAFSKLLLRGSVCSAPAASPAAEHTLPFKIVYDSPRQRTYGITSPWQYLYSVFHQVSAACRPGCRRKDANHNNINLNRRFTRHPPATNCRPPPVVQPPRHSSGETAPSTLSP